MRNYWKLNEIDGLLCVMPWVLEVEVVQANSIIFISLQTQKRTRFAMCFFPHLGLFVFFHFSFMLGKAQGPRHYQNKAHEARVRSLPN
jgi:hypothetical protein